MKHGVIRWIVGLALGGGIVVPALWAEEAPKALPTLLIKGQIVSVDTNDPAAPLIKVKDRYGFETPIYLTKETKIAQGDQTLTVEDLVKHKEPAVTVEYNFNITDAKRTAATVKLEPAAASSAAAVSASPQASAATATATASTPTPPAIPAAASSEAKPAAAPAASAIPAAPAAAAPATSTATAAASVAPAKEHAGTTKQ